MKIKALKKFTDKETRKAVKVGDVLDISDLRAKSAIERKLAEEVKTEKKEGNPKTSKKEKK
jgi:hypothetical protein